MRTEPSAHDIEIEDPLDFLSAKEKEAFLRMQKEKKAQEDAFYEEDFDDIEYDTGGGAFVEEGSADHAAGIIPGAYEDYNAYRADLKDLMEEEEELGYAPGRLSREKKRGTARRGTAGQQAKPVYEKRAAREKTVKQARREKARGEVYREKTPEKVYREKAPKEVYRDKGEEEATAAQRRIDKAVVLCSRLVLAAIIVVLLYTGFQVIRTVRGLQSGESSVASEALQGGGTELPGDEAVQGERMVTTTDLRLRSAPDTTDATIVTTVTRGTELIRTSEENGWSVVIYQDQTLYCATQYLEAAP